MRTTLILCTLIVLFAPNRAVGQSTAPVPVKRAVAEQLVGKVVGVTDGDTITVLVNQTPLKVRLDGIDAPESGQAMGAKAKQRLSELCFGKPCRLIVAGKDRYGRTLAKVGVETVYVNKVMLTDGLAWHFVRYNREPGLAVAQAEAMKAKRGVWGDPASIPPWDWRDRNQQPTGDPPADASPPPVASLAPRSDVSNVAESNPSAPLSHWLNVSTGVRHNSSCRHYGAAKNGRACEPDDGKACKLCGG